jgi:hypothetical protein
MESADAAASSFDNYIRKLGKVSAGASALLAAMWLVINCGNIVAALYSLAQIILLLGLLWIPLLFRRIKGIPLANESAKWALIASVSVFAVLLLSSMVDTSDGSCFR